MKCNNAKWVLAFALFFTASRAQEPEKIKLPDMGDSAGALISPLEEKELGDAFFRRLHSAITINNDPEIQQYIQAVGQRLAANSDAPGSPFHFFVVIDKSINAFAGPGGYIGINSGLLITTDSESEMASVMAHEIAHVTQRHLYRAFEAASQLSLPTAAAMLAAILLGTQNAELGMAALTAIQAGSIQMQINFTRSNEQEADRIGMQTLVGSGFDPRGMPAFFLRLQQSSRYYGKGIPEFLRTHPVTVSRIADTRGRAENFPYRQYPDSIDYLLTKAKLRINTLKNNDDLVRYFSVRKNLGTSEQRAVARYGLGLLALKKQKFKRAEKNFQQLVNEYPNQPQYATALAKTALDARQYKVALKRYRQAQQNFPRNSAVKLEYITTLLKSGYAKKAYQALDNLNAKEKQQPNYFRLLAEAYGAQKQQAKSHRYMAEHYYATGQTRKAITQIKLAQKSKDLNFYLAAILDERLNYFIGEEQERKRNQ
jgi:predicted Zn-dependent protease